MFCTLMFLIKCLSNLFNVMYYTTYCELIIKISGRNMCIYLKEALKLVSNYYVYFCSKKIIYIIYILKIISNVNLLFTRKKLIVSFRITLLEIMCMLEVMHNFSVFFSANCDVQNFIVIHFKNWNFF